MLFLTKIIKAVENNLKLSPEADLCCAIDSTIFARTAALYCTVGVTDELIEEESLEPVAPPPQTSRLPLQDTQLAPLSKPDTTSNSTSSYQQNKRNSSVSSEPGTNKKQTKSSEANKLQRIQDISKDTENRALLTKSPSAKSLDRGGLVSNVPRKDSSEHSVGATSRATSRKTRASALKPQGGGVTTPTNSPRKGRREEGWKEVGRRYCIEVRYMYSVCSNLKIFDVLYCFLDKVSVQN